MVCLPTSQVLCSASECNKRMKNCCPDVIIMMIVIQRDENPLWIFRLCCWTPKQLIFCISSSHALMALSLSFFHSSILFIPLPILPRLQSERHPSSSSAPSSSMIIFILRCLITWIRKARLKVKDRKKKWAFPPTSIYGVIRFLHLFSHAVLPPSNASVSSHLFIQVFDDSNWGWGLQKTRCFTSNWFKGGGGGEDHLLFASFSSCQLPNSCPFFLLFMHASLLTISSWSSSWPSSSCYPPLSLLFIPTELLSSRPPPAFVIIPNAHQAPQSSWYA